MSGNPRSRACCNKAGRALVTQHPALTLTPIRHIDMKADCKITSGAQAATMTVLISPVIEREFKRRDIFQELRLETAARIQNGATGVHSVSTAVAHALLADAQAMQRRAHELPRGIPTAYSALVRNIGAALKQEARRGLWTDPGLDEMKKRAAQSPACFEVGDTVLYFAADDDYGSEVRIVHAYGMYCVGDDAGAFISASGHRVMYQSGYLVRVEGSESDYFAKACELTRGDCKPAHLCLVR